MVLLTVMVLLMIMVIVLLIVMGNGTEEVTGSADGTKDDHGR